MTQEGPPCYPVVSCGQALAKDGTSIADLAARAQTFFRILKRESRASSLLEGLLMSASSAVPSFPSS